MSALPNFFGGANREVCEALESAIGTDISEVRIEPASAAEGLQLQQAESAECEPYDEPLAQSLPGEQWTAGVTASPRYSHVQSFYSVNWLPLWQWRLSWTCHPSQSDSLLSLAGTLRCCTLLSLAKQLNEGSGRTIEAMHGGRRHRREIKVFKRRWCRMLPRSCFRFPCCLLCSLLPPLLSLLQPALLH